MEGERLSQPATDEVEGLLGGPFADALAVAAEGALDGVGFLGVAEGDVDKAYGLEFGAIGGAGDPGDSETQGCAGVAANAIGEGFGYLAGDGAALGDQIGRNAGEGSLEFVGVDNGSAEEGARAAGDSRDAFGDHASGAAFGDGKCGLAKAEKIEDDLLQRFSRGGVEPVFENFFHASRQLVDTLLR